MDKAQLKRALLSVINKYLHDTPLCDCEDWAAVYQLAKIHSLVGIFHLATKEASLPQEVLDLAKDDFEVLVMQQVLQDYAAQELFEKFKQSDIPFLPMKGYNTRKLYPNPEARSSCDLDLFYEKSKKEALDEIMKEEGFSFVIENAAHQEWEKGPVTVETHYALSGQAAAYDKYYDDVWERLNVVEGSQYAFSKEDEYIYFIVHSAKHLIGGGIGVRTVLDAYLYVQEDLDYDYVNDQLRTLELQKFEAQLSNLARSWFGGEKETAETEFFGAFVLSSGTYGNRSNLAASGGADSVAGAKGRHLWFSLFPRYRDMKSWYPVVKKFPPLLPFVWVYRWFEVLFTHRKGIVSVAKDVQRIDKRRLGAMKKLKEMTGLPL